MQAVLRTTHGAIRLNLFAEQTPITVANFTGLATGSKQWQDPLTGEQSNDAFYDGCPFHRVIAGFMIQGGDRLGTGTGGPGYTFDDEIVSDLKFDRPYLLAMANAGLRGGHGTNGSQFFITVTATPHLNGKHTIFGEVADAASRAVVDKIANTPTNRNDQPQEPVVIESVLIEQPD
jgi:peptidyl-prolyl cis-trans isomerase A (cyclophilin A)